MTQHYLATPLRRALEKAIKEARVVAEAGASDAIRRLGVAEGKAPTYLSDDEKELRRRLRAHSRALGDRLDKDSDEQEVKRLVEAAAYAHWHRMLFARFLAERGLLRHPEHNVPVTLEDCREISQEEGAADAWAVAERYAASMLPAVFRIDDPVLSLALDAAQNQALHRLVTELDDDVFQAEDSLGWTYQFWRATEKDAVNRKGDKIGADEISAVTQLFTEPYMVRFLLHNTLGAWWAGKVLAARPDLAKSAENEDELQTACILPGYSFDMLRFVKEGGGEGARWQPAAGTFPGWPKEAKDITLLDPCCGSGHFLTEALAILSALRRAEEGLAASDAVAAVLRDNLHGLEIDGRCVQIAAFAVALTAWRIGGWQTLPLPHIAWVGAPPPLPRAEFMALADGDDELQRALAALHNLFSRAPMLGSLLQITDGDLMNPLRLARVDSLLEPLLERARKVEPELSEGVVAARGMADATALLHKKYTLQATNVPFLGRGKQSSILAEYIDESFSLASADLAAAMIARMTYMTARFGAIAVLSPQTWYFLSSYRAFRRQLIEQMQINLAVGLGSGAFETISGEVVNVSMTITSRARSFDQEGYYNAIDLNGFSSPKEKAEKSISTHISRISNRSLSDDRDARITTAALASGSRLEKYATYHNGIVTGDTAQYVFSFWEIFDWRGLWIPHQTAVAESALYAGKSNILRWGDGRLRAYVEERLEGNTGAWLRGTEIWGRSGISVAGMSLNATLYEGTGFDNNSSVVMPKDNAHLGPIWLFCHSDEYRSLVRQINQKVSVTDSSFVKIPFDFEHWKNAFSTEYPAGLPDPYSDSPSQWLFHGHPSKALRGTALHIGLARLCGYRWPAETDQNMRLSEEARERIARAATLPDGDGDGLLAVAGVAGEKPLADRLRAYLANAFDADWSDALERRLVAEADEVLDKKQARDGSLEAWLRDRAFRQHCVLFHQRPFLWHIWDGLKDGFSVFVHYHRFTQANLRKLTYTMLGDWLARAKAENNDLRYEKGRELQQMLEKVLEGEAPHDIFVRWKPLSEQPLGWDPDIDDGVRMNIRPFIEAGILRDQPKGIKWTKDRGNDVQSAPWYPVFKGERINDHHTTLEEKRAARAGNPRMVAAK